MPTRGSSTRLFENWRRLIVIVVGALATAAPNTSGQTLTHTFVATVFDSRTRDPVVGAFAAAVGTERFGVTDRNGSVRIDAIPTGTRSIRIWRLGYAPIVFTATFDSAVVQVLQAPILLEALPVVLPEVVIEADRTRLVVGPVGEFYRREREGVGWFFTREDIDKRGADELRQIVRVVPGLDVQYQGNFRWTIRLGGNNQRVSCPVVYFVDGIQSNEQMALSIRPERLEGIEIYRRPAEIPVEFNVRGASCGVIAMWSRQ